MVSDIEPVWVNHRTRLRRFPVHDESLLGKSSPRMKAAASQSPPTHARSPNTSANNASASDCRQIYLDGLELQSRRVAASLNPLLGSG